MRTEQMDRLLKDGLVLAGKAIPTAISFTSQELLLAMLIVQLNNIEEQLAEHNEHERLT